MKNKKMIFGIIAFLFAITGICSIQNVSADTSNLPPLTYVYYYTSTLEYRDTLWITVDSNDAVNVYVMNDEQFDTLQDSGGLTWDYCKRWRDIIYLHDSFDVVEDGMYYVVVYNKDILFDRTVDTDIVISRYYPPVKEDNYFLGIFLFIILPIIAGVVIVVVLIIRHKKKAKFQVIK